jgi:hypothetical protein
MNPTVRRKSAARQSTCTIGRRRSSPESGEELVGDSKSPEGIRVRNRPRGGASEGAAGWAEPVRSSPSGWTDRWAQAVSQPFNLV